MFSNSLVTLSHRNGAVFSYTSSSSWYAFLQRNWVSWIIYHLPPTLGVSTIHSFFFFFHHSFLGDLRCPVSQGKNTTNKEANQQILSPKPSKAKIWALLCFLLGPKPLLSLSSFPNSWVRLPSKALDPLWCPQVINTHPKREGVKAEMSCVVWATTRRGGKSHHVVLV